MGGAFFPLHLWAVSFVELPLLLFTIRVLFFRSTNTSLYFTDKLPTCHLEQTAKETATTLLVGRTPPEEVATITLTPMDLTITPTTTVAHTTTVETEMPLTLLLVDSPAPTLPPSKVVYR